jgi:D-amino-acid oxidase
MKIKERISVIGAGINGLCTTLKLVQSGYRVDLFAETLSPETWSNAASAVWMQFKANPMDKVIHWLYQTYDWCQELEKHPASGVKLLDYREYHQQKTRKPYFLDDIHHDYQSIPNNELLQFASGFKSVVYRMDSSLLLPYLLEQINRYDCNIIQKHIQSFYDELLSDYNIIINCTGADNYLLTKDEDAFPISGQYLLIEKIEGLDTIHLCIVDDENYIAVVPRTNDIWLGGSSVSKSWDNEIKSNLTEKILKHCIKLIPEIEYAKVLKQDVGFRSGRTHIRVEHEQLNNRHIIHNYGQGGSGFSLCWGCAEEVVSIIRAVNETIK